MVIRNMKHVESNVKIVSAVLNTGVCVVTGITKKSLMNT